MIMKKNAIFIILSFFITSNLSLSYAQDVDLTPNYSKYYKIIKDENDVLQKQRLISKLIKVYNEGNDSIQRIIDRTIQLEYKKRDINNKLAQFEGEKESNYIDLSEDDTISNLKTLSIDTISQEQLLVYSKKEKKKFLSTYCNENLLDKLRHISYLISNKSYVNSDDAISLYVSLNEETLPSYEEQLNKKLQLLLERRQRGIEYREESITRTINRLRDGYISLEKETNRFKDEVLVKHSDVSNVLTNIVDETSDVNEALKQIEALDRLDKYIFKGVEMDDEYNIKFVVEYNGEKLYWEPNYKYDVMGYSFNDSYDILKGVVHQVEAPIRSYNSWKAIGEIFKEQAKQGTYATKGMSHISLALSGFERKLLKIETSGGHVFKYYHYTHPNKEYKSFTVIMEDDIIVSVL